MLGVPSGILQIPDEAIHPSLPRPQVALAVQGVIGFKNEGEKHEPSQPLTPQEFLSLPKEDITGSVTPRDEPMNEFVATRRGIPPILVRTKTVVLKAEVIKDRWTPTGDPILQISHNTSHSVSELPDGEIYTQ